MKRHEYQLIDEIVALWELYDANKTRQIEIALAGPTTLQRLVEFHFDAPPASDYKPDVVALKADLLRQCVITKDQQRAHDVIFSLPDKVRRIVTDWPQLRGKRINGEDRRWTLADVALSCGINDLERFLQIRALLCSIVLRRWRERSGLKSAC